MNYSAPIIIDSGIFKTTVKVIWKIPCHVYTPAALDHLFLPLLLDQGCAPLLAWCLLKGATSDKPCSNLCPGAMTRRHIRSGLRFCIPKERHSLNTPCKHILLVRRLTKSMLCNLDNALHVYKCMANHFIIHVNMPFCVH